MIHDDQPPIRHSPGGPPCEIERRIASRDAPEFTVTFCDGTTDVRPRAEWAYDRILLAHGGVALRSRR